MSGIAIKALDLARLIDGNRYHFTDEKELQAGIAGVLQEAGIEFEREVRLEAHGRDRIDFLVGDIGVEIKIKGSASALVRQVYRYLQHEQIHALVVVTTRVRHGLPSTMNGKLVFVVHLWRQGI